MNKPSAAKSRHAAAKSTGGIRTRHWTPAYDWSGNYGWSSTTKMTAGLRPKPYRTTATEADCCVATHLTVSW